MTAAIAIASDEVRRSVLLTLTEHRGCTESFLARLFGPATPDALVELGEEGRARLDPRGLWFLVRSVARDPDAPMRSRILGRLSRAQFHGDGWMSALQLASDLAEPSTVVGPVLRYLRESALVEASDNRRAMRWRISPKGIGWLQAPGALPTRAVELAVPEVVAYVRLHGPCPRQQVVDAVPHLSKRRTVDACRLAQARQLIDVLPGRTPLLVCPLTHARATSLSSPRSAAREPRLGSGRPTADAAASRAQMWGDPEGSRDAALSAAGIQP